MRKDFTIPEYIDWLGNGYMQGWAPSGVDAGGVKSKVMGWLNSGQPPGWISTDFSAANIGGVVDQSGLFSRALVRPGERGKCRIIVDEWLQVSLAPFAIGAATPAGVLKPRQIFLDKWVRREIESITARGRMAEQSGVREFNERMRKIDEEDGRRIGYRQKHAGRDGGPPLGASYMSAWDTEIQRDKAELNKSIPELLAFGPVSRMSVLQLSEQTVDLTNWADSIVDSIMRSADQYHLPMNDPIGPVVGYQIGLDGNDRGHSLGVMVSTAPFFNTRYHFLDPNTAEFLNLSRDDFHAILVRHLKAFYQNYAGGSWKLYLYKNKPPETP